MSDTPAPAKPRVDHLGRAPIYIGIIIFAMQILSQYSMFFQLPEKVKVVLGRLDNLQEIAAKGAVLHEEKEEQLAAIKHLVQQREEAHKMMVDDDRSQWEAIRELDRRIDELTNKGTP